MGSSFTKGVPIMTEDNLGTRGLQAERRLIEGLQARDCDIDFNGHLDNVAKLDFVVYRFRRMPSYLNFSVGVQFTTNAGDVEKLEKFKASLSKCRPAVNIIVYLEVDYSIAFHDAMHEMAYALLLNVAFDDGFQDEQNWIISIRSDMSHTKEQFEIKKPQKIEPVRRQHKSEGCVVRGKVVFVNEEAGWCCVDDENDGMRYHLKSVECSRQLWGEICNTPYASPVRIIGTVGKKYEHQAKPPLMNVGRMQE